MPVCEILITLRVVYETDKAASQREDWKLLSAAEKSVLATKGYKSVEVQDSDVKLISFQA